MLLKLLELHADGRLRPPHPLGGFTEAARLDQGHEGAQQPYVEVNAPMHVDPALSNREKARLNIVEQSSHFKPDAFRVQAQ